MGNIMVNSISLQTAIVKALLKVSVMAAHRVVVKVLQEMTSMAQHMVNVVVLRRMSIMVLHAGVISMFLLMRARKSPWRISSSLRPCIHQCGPLLESVILHSASIFFTRHSYSFH